MWLLLQVRASTATWVATLPYVEFSTVVLQDNNIFLAFFESESGNKAAAAYALASAHRVSQLTLVSPDLPKFAQTTALYIIQTLHQQHFFALCRHLRLLRLLDKVTCKACYKPHSHPWMRASLLTHTSQAWCDVRIILHRRTLLLLTATQLVLSCRIVHHQVLVASLFTSISRRRSCGQGN